MRMLGRCLVLSAALLASNIGAAVAESTPAAYKCTFNTGSSRSYSKGTYRAKPVKPLSLEIADIDLDNQRASLITENGKGALRAIRAINANHFIEAVTEGYLNLTTIYDFDPRRKAHPAVHSRHFGLFGEPVVAQYTGFCLSK
jgi:hypothetical protein